MESSDTGRILDYKTKENLLDDQRKWLDEHPDFNWDEDVAEATKIADALKEEGWDFASHTWGHLSVTGKSVDALRTDNEKWVNTVQNIVGPTDTIIFAHGNDIGSWEGYTSDNEIYNYFKSVGYNFYCNVDSSQPLLGTDHRSVCPARAVSTSTVTCSIRQAPVRRASSTI